jgi:hypothetical protein
MKVLNGVLILTYGFSARKAKMNYSSCEQTVIIVRKFERPEATNVYKRDSTNQIIIVCPLSYCTVRTRC